MVSVFTPHLLVYLNPHTHLSFRTPTQEPCPEPSSSSSLPSFLCRPPRPDSSPLFQRPSPPPSPPRHKRALLLKIVVTVSRQTSVWKEGHSSLISTIFTPMTKNLEKLYGLFDRSFCFTISYVAFNLF
ncbi:hypothetical protein Hdeb2414_s0016g00474001 [Helianthus debilis subsp. tardiflorus]